MSKRADQFLVEDRLEVQLVPPYSTPTSTGQ